MIVDRIYTPGLAQVAYLVVDEAAKVAAVIDPRRDTDAYLEWAAVRDLRIEAVLETHVHADFVSGARELAAATGATIYASRRGEQKFPHHPLDDGDEVVVGRLRLRAFWTPGHTPEHLGYLLIDPDAGPELIALFSGDVLFAGEIGRPDLLGPEQTQELVEHLYDTVVNRLSTLPDDVVVYPGHTAGSPCGKKIGDAPQTTIGQEKRFNYAFQARSKDEFVQTVMEGMPQPPAYYPMMKRVNKVGPVLLRELRDGSALSPDEVAARQAEGALVIDARSPEAFGAGHVPGAVSVGLGSSFAIWAGWLAPYDRDLIIILDDDERFGEARTELRRIGLDRVAGYLAGGIDAWRASGRELVTLPQMTVRDVASYLAEHPNELVVLDVRDATEWTSDHIPGAMNQFVGEIAQGAEVPISPSQHVAVVCGSGYRSSVAASVLQARGMANLVNVTGGISAWEAADLPTTQEPVPGPAEVRVEQFLREWDPGETQLVDVREPDEWAEGHAPGAALIPLGELAARQGELDPARPVVTICRSGRRSLDAAEILLGAGFRDARSLAGGMIAWRDAGLPVER
ncbi:MAG: putative metallo-hydrolase [Propionibacteriaceae bacterium]|nr:putative metallo-hydrolase [Propionibacteriaceae bacterium]